MKFPKLKHTALCQLLLYAPLLADLLVCVLLPLLRIGPADLWVACFLGGSVLALVYLFSQAPVLLLSDAVLSQIRFWKRDQLEVRSFRNGRGRAQAERRILRRCRLWGRPWTEGSGPFRIYYRHCQSPSVFFSLVEKRVAVCSVEELTADSFRILLGQARGLMRRIPNGKPRFKTKAEKRAPVAQVWVAVFLADRVDGELAALARRSAVSGEEQALLPCVVECPSGKIWFDGAREPYEPGMTPRPAKNRARSLLKRLVFAGVLPRSRPELRPPWDIPGFSPEMSLWDLIRELKGDPEERRQARLLRREERERRSMRRRLGEYEAALGKYAVYCKYHGKLALCRFTREGEDGKGLVLRLEPRFYAPRPDGLGENHRKMRPEDEADLRILFPLALSDQGCRVRFED